MHAFMEQWFTQHEEDIIALAFEIFKNPECSHKEYASCKTLGTYLQAQGFTVEYGVGGLDTAFMASFGDKGPKLGFLAEYDALPHLAQNPVPYKSSPHAHSDKDCGHGCGHNLLGAGVVAAACALKDTLEKNAQDACIIVYGCPAEEVLHGKIVMNNAKLFHDLNAAITWHPFDRNRISYDIWLAHDIKKYTFTGTSSHAAKAPELGRSALDAAELMHVGVNYLREHVPSTVRMHYAYTKADTPPNIVPDFVQTSHYIRAATRQILEDVSLRIDNCAKGACLMTGTNVDIELVAFCREMKVNTVLAKAFYEAMSMVALPTYSQNELNFAQRISEAAHIDNEGCYFSGLEPLEDSPNILPIGTDVAEVSHTVPTVTISAATMCKGTALHHWATTAQSGMSIGFKGMIYAAKCMALGALSLVNNPSILQKALEEHIQK